MLELAGQSAAGQGVSTDIIEAAALAYVRALSNAERRVHGGGRDAAGRGGGGGAQPDALGGFGQLGVGGAVEHRRGDDRVGLGPGVLVLGRASRGRRSPPSRRSGRRRRPGSARPPRRRRRGARRARAASARSRRGRAGTGAAARARQQHRLLALHVGAREQRLDRRRGGEQPRVEDVHQLVAARGDEVEARLERIQVHEDPDGAAARAIPGACARPRSPRTATAAPTRARPTRSASSHPRAARSSCSASTSKPCVAQHAQHLAVGEVELDRVAVGVVPLDAPEPELRAREALGGRLRVRRRAEDHAAASW